ncbi:hydroxylase, partial [Escherichia coli]|nr:hydroxylase [Escherichia coli]
VVWPHYLKRRAPGTSLDAFFLETVAMCPPLAARLEHAQLVTDVEATGNFSYSGDVTHGPNFLLLGDAFAFIDP